MKILRPQPAETCARCGCEVQDLEWVIEGEDGRVTHETWSRAVCDRQQRARQMELAL